MKRFWFVILLVGFYFQIFSKSDERVERLIQFATTINNDIAGKNGVESVMYNDDYIVFTMSKDDRYGITPDSNISELKELFLQLFSQSIEQDDLVQMVSIMKENNVGIKFLIMIDAGAVEVKFKSNDFKKIIE